MSFCPLIPLQDIVTDIQSGFASGENTANGIVQVRMNNVDTSGHLEFNSIRRVPATEKQIKKYSLHPGDVLFNNTNSSDLVGKSAIFKGYDEPVVYSNHFTRIRTDKKKLHSGYLVHFFVNQWSHRVFAGLCTRWVNQAAVRKESLLSLKIPLLPLPEQKRIATILDKADSIRRKRQEALALADTFLRSVFLKMFGDPVTNSMGWDEVLLKNVASICSGVTKGKKYKELNLVEVPYMRVANVQDGWIDTTDIKSIYVSPTDVARFSMVKGDLLLTEGGDPDKLGRGAVWDGSISPCIHQNHIFKVRFDTSSILPEFASFLIGSNRGKRYFLRAAKQTTGIATINKTQLSNFKMLVPNMKLQQQFSDTVLRAKVTWKKLEQLADVSNNMFFSLQQRAFRGDL